MRIYNCDICRQQGWNKIRKCYLDEDEFPLNIPIVDEYGTPTGGHYEEIVNKERFFQLLSEFQSYRTEEPLLNIATVYFKEVCVQSLFDSSDIEVVNLENLAKEYHIFPDAGGIFDQPNIFIEALDSIMSARNMYYRIRDEEMQKKINSMKAGNVSTGSMSPKRR